MDGSGFLITGAGGQLGLALAQKYPAARAVGADKLDISDWQAVQSFDWGDTTAILNAAAYTNVDGAETVQGRVAAWQVNAVGTANLARIAIEKDLTLVHISTDYVFDGTKDNHQENEPFSPLSVYGQTKAAGDIAAALVPKHYVLRTSWVIGEGKNFVRTMLGLGQKGISPTVVHDQVGRLTFTRVLADAIDHLVSKQLPSGVYNLTNSGQPGSWADVTREIFQAAGFNLEVKTATTKEYYQGKEGIAPRPQHSAFDLSKIEATGFKPADWHDNLREYVKKELDK